MDNAREQHVRRIFDGAMDRPPEERPVFLDGACADDPNLRRRLEAMVAAAGEGGFLSDPTRSGTDSTVATPLREGPGTRIGPYKLLQLLGEGGFGAVFMADQEHPVRRRVALKVIKLGMDTRQVIARFEAERQALAMMDHPHIARVLDAGATESGRPFFVMELVKGVPITEYCDANNLTARERLELFVPVCQAVQHAHHKGVIHRDIKPGNILVTLHDGKPVPKVIDFGIAKAVEQRLTEKTLFTEHQQMIGTPEYMSPEQAEMSGLDIDTRTDVYSLGVLLYELLTGTTPFDAGQLRSAGYAEIQRIIREVEPPKPSTRVSTLGASLTAIAGHRKTEPGRLGLLLRGDLDWIVMRCLEKDRTRRYDTPTGLAEDIRRHLGGEAVVAAPPSAGYRLRKFAKRNRKMVVAVSCVVGALALGTAGTTWGFVLSASRAKSEGIARTEAQSAQKEAMAEAAKSRAAAAVANRARGETELTAYAANVFAAQAAVERGDADGAYQRLEQCPPTLRNFEWHHVAALADQSITTSNLSPSKRTAMFIVPDNSRAIAVLDNNDLRLLSLPDTRELARCRMNRGYVNQWKHDSSIIFSQDGQRAIVRQAASWDGIIMLLDVASMKEVRAFGDGNVFRGDACFSPDSKLLSILDYSRGHLSVHLARNGDHVADITLPTSAARAVRFSPDSSHLLIGTEAGDMFVWSVDGATLTNRKRAHEAAIAWIDPSPDGTLLLTASIDEQICVWHASAPEPFAQIREERSRFVDFDPHERTAWAPDSRRIAIPTATTIIVRDISALDGVRVVNRELPIADSLERVRVSFSPNGQLLAVLQSSIRSDSTRFPRLSVWDLNSGNAVLEAVAPKPAVFTHAAFSPDSSLFAAATSDGRVILKATIANKPVRTLLGHRRGVTSLSFAQDENTLLTCSDDGTIRTWDATGPVPLADLPRNDGHSYSWAWNNSDHIVALDNGGHLSFVDPESGESTCDFAATYGELVTFMPQGHTNRCLATTAMQHQIVAGDPLYGGAVFDSATTFPVRKLQWSEGWSQPMCVSRDLRRTILWHESSNGAPRIAIHDTASGMETASLSAKANYANARVFSPDSTCLALALDDGTVGMFETESGKELGRLRAGSATVSAVAFSDDGSLLAAGGADGTMTIWRWSSGGSVFTTAPQQGEVRAVVFSPDGSRVATASEHQVTLWAVDRGTELLAWSAASPSVVSFSPDGTRLLVGNKTKFFLIDSRAEAIRFRERELRREVRREGADAALDALAKRGGRVDDAAHFLRSTSTRSGEVRDAALKELRIYTTDLRGRVAALFEQHFLVADTVAGIQKDATLAPGVKADMIALAEFRGDTPQAIIRDLLVAVAQISENSMWVASTPKESTRMQAAIAAATVLWKERPREPDSVYLLGMALYRARQFDDALRVLREAEGLATERGEDEWMYSAAAYAAVCELRLGRVDDARTSLGKLQLVRRTRFGGHRPGYATVIEQADKLIEGK